MIKIFDSYITPEISIQSVNGKNLLIVEIFPGSHKPYFLKNNGKDKGTYIRIGSTNRKASSEILMDLERQRRNIFFDSEPCYNLSLTDIDLSPFLLHYNAVSKRNLDESHLYNLGLLVNERETTYPTNAAILLSENGVRERLFPFAKIECARFKNKAMDYFVDQMTVNLPLHRAAEACMTFIKKNIALGARIGEIYREERWEYPLEAIRESIINAIVHRDYSQQGSDIKVAIYDHKLEITSPGHLPETLTLDDLGTGRSVIRNRTLAIIFKDLKLIEAWGTGILKIKETQKDYSEIDINFKEVGYAFQVEFIKK